MDRLSVLQNEIEYMRKALNDREHEAYALKKSLTPNVGSDQELNQNYETQQYQYEVPQVPIEAKLQRWAIERYSRQILLPDIGVDGQQKLCDARVLIVGAGGLGCPAGAYLAGAGVGEIGIVDYDTVDVTNLHRQILHGEEDQGMDKVDSAANALRRLNSKIKVDKYNVQLDSKNALDIISKYDVVLDCSDNVPTRYLLNDACVLLKVPLISGSALKMEGQLTIYCYRGESNPNEKGPTLKGPCYRCLFPIPPAPETMGSCSSHGVAGPVTGTIGSLQALEAIKLIVGKTCKSLLVARMLIFDGEDTTFRTVKMRAKNPECPSCSDSPTVTELLDYESFCKSQAKEKDIDLEILLPEERITPEALADILEKTKLENNEKNHLIIDVRGGQEYKMCNIEKTKNYPVNDLANEKVFQKMIADIENYSQDLGQINTQEKEDDNSIIIIEVPKLNNIHDIDIFGNIIAIIHGGSPEEYKYFDNKKKNINEKVIKSKMLRDLNDQSLLFDLLQVQYRPIISTGNIIDASLDLTYRRNNVVNKETAQIEIADNNNNNNGRSMKEINNINQPQDQTTPNILMNGEAVLNKISQHLMGNLESSLKMLDDNDSGDIFDDVNFDDQFAEAPVKEDDRQNDGQENNNEQN